LSPRTIREYKASPPEIKAEVLALIQVRRRAENARITLAYLGPVLGFIVVLSFLGVSAWLINGDHDIAGTFLGVVDIVSLAGVFVLGNPQGSPRTGNKDSGLSGQGTAGELAIQTQTSDNSIPANTSDDDLTSPR
jgi:hypothetical protein